jgi:hypothetical protein
MPRAALAHGSAEVVPEMKSLRCVCSLHVLARSAGISRFLSLHFQCSLRAERRPLTIPVHPPSPTLDRWRVECGPRWTPVLTNDHWLVPQGTWTDCAGDLRTIYLERDIRTFLRAHDYHDKHYNRFGTRLSPVRASDGQEVTSGLVVSPTLAGNASRPGRDGFRYKLQVSGPGARQQRLVIYQNVYVSLRSSDGYNFDDKFEARYVEAFPLRPGRAAAVDYFLVGKDWRDRSMGTMDVVTELWVESGGVKACLLEGTDDGLWGRLRGSRGWLKPSGAVTRRRVVITWDNREQELPPLRGEDLSTVVDDTVHDVGEE